MAAWLASRAATRFWRSCWRQRQKGRAERENSPLLGTLNSGLPLPSCLPACLPACLPSLFGLPLCPLFPLLSDPGRTAGQEFRKGARYVRQRARPIKRVKSKGWREGGCIWGDRVDRGRSSSAQRPCAHSWTERRGGGGGQDKPNVEGSRKGQTTRREACYKARTRRVRHYRRPLAVYSAHARLPIHKHQPTTATAIFQPQTAAREHAMELRISCHPRRLSSGSFELQCVADSNAQPPQSVSSADSPAASARAARHHRPTRAGQRRLRAAKASQVSSPVIAVRKCTNWERARALLTA